MAITKDQLRALRVSMDAALATIAKEHGLASLKSGPCTFDPSGSFTFKVEGLAEGGLAKEERRYDDSMWLGLPPRGSEFKQGGHTHKTWGLNTTGSKIITVRDDGKKYTWATDVVKRFFPDQPRPKTHAELLGQKVERPQQ